MFTKKDLEKIERETLASYAMLSSETKGRDHSVISDNYRTEFQRDRDRIIHCSAFRILKYKTQVFVIHEGDYYRTRLTHTMEVSQIARTISKNLGLNCDLVEAISLAHDVGHTPFGHAGEKMLNLLMEDEGGFDHNTHGLRVVEYLEKRYHDFPGLNLTWEVREGIIKHKTSYDSPSSSRFAPNESPTLETQVVNVADEIAFNNHDVDDALKMGMISFDDLREVPWVWEIFQEGIKKSGGNPDQYARLSSVRNIINEQVSNVLKETEKRIKKYKIKNISDVRNTPVHVVSFSEDMKKKNAQFRDFLMKNVYRNYKVIRMTKKYEGFIEKMFKQFLEEPKQLHPDFQKRLEKESLKRVITDYIAGMTDTFLEEEYIRMFEPTLHAIKR